MVLRGEGRLLQSDSLLAARQGRDQRSDSPLLMLGSTLGGATAAAAAAAEEEHCLLGGVARAE